MDKTQKAQVRFERTARNMVDGPLSMFYYDDLHYGRIYVAVGKRQGVVEIAKNGNIRYRDQEHQPWTGLWWAMIGEVPFGQEIRALPANWTEQEIMTDVVAQAQPTLKSFMSGGAFQEGWWRAGKS